MKITAGLLLFRRKESGLEFLIVHPGGPFWSKKDLGVWSIPKGVPDHGEIIESAAIREFREETGYNLNINSHELINLGTTKYNDKIMYCFALEKDIGDFTVKSNNFDIEWPPKSGKMQSFPEVDKGGYFDFKTASEKLNKQQVVFLERVIKNPSLTF